MLLEKEEIYSIILFLNSYNMYVLNFSYQILIHFIDLLLINTKPSLELPMMV